MTRRVVDPVDITISGGNRGAWQVDLDCPQALGARQIPSVLPRRDAVPLEREMSRPCQPPVAPRVGATSARRSRSDRSIASRSQLPTAGPQFNSTMSTMSTMSTVPTPSASADDRKSLGTGPIGSSCMGTSTACEYQLRQYSNRS